MICRSILCLLVIALRGMSLRIVPTSPKTKTQKCVTDFTSVVWSAVSVAGASALSKPKEVLASESLVFPKDCSDSVVVLRGPNNREVVIIGTAHISEESVEVVKRTINGVDPDVVMIELDLKRLGRVVEKSPEGKNRVLSEAESAQRMVERGFILPSEVSAAAPVRL